LPEYLRDGEGRKEGREGRRKEGREYFSTRIISPRGNIQKLKRVVMSLK
jgi:hypothetical protein